VREKLVIHATGRVSGKIRYGKLVVEEGGQLSGDVVHGDCGRGARGGAANRHCRPPEPRRGAVKMRRMQLPSKFWADLGTRHFAQLAASEH
jgi:hypothetical protein